MGHRLIAVNLLACIVVTSSIHAESISVDLIADFTSGPLAGQKFTGVLVYDDANLTGVGDEILVPEGGGTEFFPSTVEGVLSFSITIDGDLFLLRDDVDFPDYPALSFRDNRLDGVDYVTDEEPLGIPSLFFIVDPLLILQDNLVIPVEEEDKIENVLSYFSADGVESTGVALIPEPSTFALAALGLLGLLGRRRRERRRPVA